MGSDRYLWVLPWVTDFGLCGGGGSSERERAAGAPLALCGFLHD
jgi:hypothetical protein